MDVVVIILALCDFELFLLGLWCLWGKLADFLRHVIQVKIVVMVHESFVRLFPLENLCLHLASRVADALALAVGKGESHGSDVLDHHSDCHFRVLTEEVTNFLCLAGFWILAHSFQLLQRMLYDVLRYIFQA